MHLPARKKLRNGIEVEIDWMHPQDGQQVRALFNTVIVEGETYPQDKPLSDEEFTAYWLNRDAFVVRAVEDTNIQQQRDRAVLGAFFLKPNFPGRCSHIANAGFIVQPQMRGQGIGRLMGEEMLKIAANLGDRAVMFNLVFETNIPSIRLWKSLGFETIGRIPKAVISDGKVVDALMMYKSLGAGDFRF